MLLSSAPARTRRRARVAPLALASCLAFSTTVVASAMAGCSSGATPPVPAAAESVAHSSAALSVSAPSSFQGLFAVAGTQLQQGAPGGSFIHDGDAYGVTAFAGFHGNLYVASNDQLWVRGALGASSGNDWTKVGDAKGAVAMTFHQGLLYMVAENQLWQRYSIAPGVDWAAVGDATGITQLASYAGQLYGFSGQALVQLNPPGTGGNAGVSWSYAGDAYGVTAMASSGGHLYVVANGQLWQRGNIGPGSGNDWSPAGSAANVTALTSLPIDCVGGFSASDCPAPGVDLTGLTNVAAGHVATASSTSGTLAASLADDGSLATAAVTNVESTPSIAVDLSFDRIVSVIGIATTTPSAVVDLLDSSGNVVATEPLSSFTAASGMYIVGVSPVTARTVRVHASSPSGVALSVAEVQVFAPLVPSSYLPFWKHQAIGTCWRSTYGRGVGAPVSSCDSDQDKDGALCYPQCAPGYYGVGPVCWQSCPSGWTDTGVACLLPGSIVSADNSSCPWYDKCGLTFDRGCSVCPPGYANDGCTCRVDPQDFTKSSYGRGAGVPLHCGSSQDEQAALCYAQCSSGYDGVGPVCWHECSGGDSVACGALACASSSAACTTFVQETVDSTVSFAINAAALVLTWGGSGPLSEVTAIGGSVAQKGVQALTDEIANVLIASYNGTSLTGNPVDGTSRPSLSQDVAEVTSGQIVQALQTGQINWTLIDPTGILAIIAAFNQPTC